MSVLVAADGAGTAACAAIGARLACQTFLTAVAADINAGFLVSDVTEDITRGWVDQARRRLSLEACVGNRELKDFACTLLAAVVTDAAAVFVQVGDGAIVIRDGETFGTVFWPQIGEYASTTNFLTGAGYAVHLMVRTIRPGPDELAVFTDGLQSLALHFQTQTVHAPFFDPLFATLRGEPDPDRLAGPLVGFLNSAAVNARTDDDKTLILATRRSPDHATEPLPH